MTSRRTAGLPGAADTPPPVAYLPWTLGQLTTLEAMAASLELQAQALRQQVSGLRLVAESLEGPPAPPPPGTQDGQAAASEYYGDHYRRP